MITTSLDYVKTDSGAGQVPFHDVLVHPTIQDSFGQRMSKSLGTGIDPLELSSIYGADATRYGLLQLAGGGQDTRFLDGAMVKLGEPFVRRWMRDHRGEPLPLEWSDADGKPTERFPQMQAARNFANKIWNASRLVLSAEAEVSSTSAETPDDLGVRWIESRLNSTILEVTRALESYEFDSAAQSLYAFIWGDFCDWFLELSKPKMRANDAAYLAFMRHVLDRTLRLLHPFMPFLSEEIWAKLGSEGGLCRVDWPVAGVVDLEIEARFTLLQDTIRAARNLKASANIAPSKPVALQLFPSTPRAEDALRAGESVLRQLANLESLSFGGERSGNATSQLAGEVEVVLPLEGLIDVEKERAKIEKQLENAHKDFYKISGKLGNTTYTARAPQDIVAKDRARFAELKEQIEILTARLAAL